MLVSGYMPVDYYNLNSAYGTEEDLKFCIDEMHKCDIQVQTKPTIQSTDQTHQFSNPPTEQQTLKQIDQPTSDR